MMNFAAQRPLPGDELRFYTLRLRDLGPDCCHYPIAQYAAQRSTFTSQLRKARNTPASKMPNISYDSHCIFPNRDCRLVHGFNCSKR